MCASLSPPPPHPLPFPSPTSPHPFQKFIAHEICVLVVLHETLRLRPVHSLCLQVNLSVLRRFYPNVKCSSPDRLFISYIKPHKPVSSATIGCWLRFTIRDDSINTDISKDHSVHSASTTVAPNGRVSLDEIMKMADGSCQSTFQKFYYKPVFD